MKLSQPFSFARAFREPLALSVVTKMRSSALSPYFSVRRRQKALKATPGSVVDPD